MIYTELGDLSALTLIRVVLERTEDEELRIQLEEYLQKNENIFESKERQYISRYQPLV